MKGKTYTVDLVVCIDSTGSMAPIIERVKASALRFYDDLQPRLVKQGKYVDQCRVKVIAFRDYYVDGKDSMRESNFFSLPEDRKPFAKFVEGITADGGGDAPETSLEALALAIRSKWTTEGAKQRHVIVMWTDTDAHPLEKDQGAKPRNYLADAPANFDALTDMWEGKDYMKRAAKRTVIFAPKAYPWPEIQASWESVVYLPSQAGGGLSDHDYHSILDVIASSC